MNEPNPQALVSFGTDSFRRVSAGYLLWLICAASFAAALYEFGGFEKYEAIAPNLWLYYTILAVHVWHRARGRDPWVVMAPDMVFILFYTLFHIGYLTLYEAGIADYIRSVFYFESATPKALFVVTLGLVSYLVGFELGGVTQRRQRVGIPRIPTPQWTALGTALLLVALGLHIGVLLSVSSDFFSIYGYRGLQNIGQYTSYTVGVFFSLSHLCMLLGAVLHVVGSALRSQRLFASTLAMGICAVFFVLFFLEGDRGPILSLGLPLVVVRHYFIKPFRRRTLVTFLVVALSIFAALGAVRTTIFAPSAMIEEYEIRVDQGDIGWESSFVEMGKSFAALNIACHEVPKRRPYWHGETWLVAVTHVVPFLQGAATRGGWFDEAPSQWVTWTYFGSEAAGRGFTVAAEGYVNFGFLGVVLQLTFIGAFVRRASVWLCRRPSATRGLIFLGIFGSSIVVVRSTLNMVTRNLFLLALLAVVLGVVFGHQRRVQSSDQRTETQ